MVGDLVGFHNNGGYLGPTVQSWVTFFPFMSVVDAFLYARNSFTQSQLALPWATTDAAAFIVGAGDYYRSLNPNFPLLQRLRRALLHLGMATNSAGTR